MSCLRLGLDAVSWMRFSVGRIALLSAIVLGLASAGPALAQELPRDPPAENDLAVMGTIPLYWGERSDMAELLDGGAPGHWARPLIEQSWRLRPLDYLSAEALSGYSRLLLAQPRGFSAEENVALDAWVRGGGRVLLFADPMMTGHSRFAIGDRRRPQDVTLLSPILTHWGLELQFDEAQPEGRNMRDSVPPSKELSLPVELAGELVLRAPAQDCALLGAGIAAECELGDGFALVVADAALFDGEQPGEGASGALEALLGHVYGNRVPPPAPR